MDTSAPPPLYSATAPPTENVESQPPQYTFPTSFKVGGVRTDGLLVSIPQIKGHLALLRAFGNLKSEVESCQNDILHMPLDKERRWAWFVGLSAERYVFFATDADRKADRFPLPGSTAGFER